MSRYSGKQGRGASRQLHDQRRTEAEVRQAEERARYQVRRVHDVEPPPLTNEELDRLLLAAQAVGRACAACGKYNHRTEFCPLLVDDMAAVTDQ